MVGQVRGIDQQVVQIYNDTNIQEVSKDIIHELLKRARGIGQPKRHNQPLVRTIVCTEYGLPFVTVGYLDQVVCMS